MPQIMSIEWLSSTALWSDLLCFLPWCGAAADNIGLMNDDGIEVAAGGGRAAGGWAHLM